MQSTNTIDCVFNLAALHPVDPIQCRL